MPLITHRGHAPHVHPDAYIVPIQQHLDFAGTVYGATGQTPPAELMARQSEWYGHHRDDSMATEN